MTKIQLRDYQTKAVNSVFSSIKEWVRLLLLVMWVGSWKTVCFSFIAKEVVKQKWKVLLIVHRTELLQQAKKTMEFIIPEAKVQIEQWDLKVDNDCDIVLASTATIGRKDWDRIKKFNKNEFKLIICDEAHRLCVDSNIRILEYFWAYKGAENWVTKWHPVVLGVTASPNRQDWLWLDKVVDRIVFTYSMQEAIKDWNLAPIKCFSVFTDTDLNSVSSSMGDFAIWELSDTINNSERNLQIVETYLEKCKNQKTVVFCADVKHAKDLCEVFIQNDIKANYITWALKKDIRADILKQFEDWQLDVILNISTLVEWWDVPSILAVFLASPTKSNIKYIQSIWRWSRNYPGKKYFKIFDFVDNIRNNKIITASSLIWITQPIKADNTDIFEMKDQLEELLNNQPGTNLRELDLDKIQERIQEVDIFKMAELDTFVKENSTLWWTPFLDGYKISLWEDDMWDKLSVEIREDTIWYIINFIVARKQEAKFQNKFKKYKNEIVATVKAHDKKEALNLADKVIRTNYSDRVNLVNQNAKWKESEATEKQVKMLQKNWYPNADQLTKGQASILISKIFANKKK